MSFREEFRRAAERRNSLPPYARPTVTRPMVPVTGPTVPVSGPEGGDDMLRQFFDHMERMAEGDPVLQRRVADARTAAGLPVVADTTAGEAEVERVAAAYQRGVKDGAESVTMLRRALAGPDDTQQDGAR